MMTNESNTMTSPIMVKVSDLLALATFSGSPPEVKSLMPDKIISTTAIIAAINNPALTILRRKYGKQPILPIIWFEHAASVGKAVDAEAVPDTTVAGRCFRRVTKTPLLKGTIYSDYHNNKRERRE